MQYEFKMLYINAKYNMIIMETYENVQSGGVLGLKVTWLYYPPC